VGLWNDATEAAIGRTLESIKRWSNIPIAIQLAHAGRKASTEVPWKSGVQIPPDHPNGWQAVAPSAIPYSNGERPLLPKVFSGGADCLSSGWHADPGATERVL
jgi:2,4-dienoyl-CoA reductase-like NADH-dependent reductase (Old Yellow Enzyme family)